MKKVLILTPLNAEDFYQELNELEAWRKNIEGVAYFSPSFIISENIKNKKEFFLGLLAAVLAIEKNGIGIDIDKLDADLFIYFGPAPTNISFDEIYCIKKDVVDTQEKYYDSLMKRQDTLLKETIITKKARSVNFHRSEESDKCFDNITDALIEISKEE